MEHAVNRHSFRIARAAVAIAAIAVLALAGCGSGKGGVATDDVPAKLDFTAKTLDGKQFRGASLAGKPAVLWFWAPWCPTCGAQAPHVTSLAKKHKGEVNVLGVAGLDDRAKMREFVKRTGVRGFPNLADEKGVVWKRFEVTAQSTYVLLDASGEVVHSGYLDDDALTRQVSELTN